MLTFSEYYNGRQGEGQALGDMDAFPSDDQLLLKVAAMAIRNHNDKIMDFFNTLAKNDGNIKRVLNNYKDNRNSNDPKTYRQQNNDDRDTIIPSSADTQGPV